ncbi:carbon monoxide dehydrogenase [Chloroflexus islandicus]|uniref:Carbon monoxide dehydrogenase n=1 Tax=Chloroflexus islandicus TaxID=1707952 RepID=A0A178MHS8_9CHLR|nr:carbon monoxide dehydrogenase subunit G [Chloroflexus islandicus]OAN48261.1 carbon monoxide dehydrogenase [Chloroflexus islandicus]
MKIAGNYTFAASRDEVWAALNDPEVLARTIPGCQRLEQVGENEYESTLKIGLQAVRGVYSGRVKIDNIQAPESYEIHVDGKGSNGFLKGSGSITLREENGQTILDYGGEAHVGGTIASVGQRLLDGAAKTLIAQSLKALAAQIEARRAGSVEATPAPAAAPEPVAVPSPAPAAAPAPEPVAAPSPAPAAAPAPEPAEAPAFRRTIHVPAGEGLSEVDVALGVVEDFLKERPWVPWVIVAFLLGYLLGQRRSG